MQDAARHSAERPADSPALAELLESVGADAERLPAGDLEWAPKLSSLEMLPLKRPFCCRQVTRLLLPMARLKPIARFEPNFSAFNPRKECARSL